MNSYDYVGMGYADDTPRGEGFGLPSDVTWRPVGEGISVPTRYQWPFGVRRLTPGEACLLVARFEPRAKKGQP